MTEEQPQHEEDCDKFKDYTDGIFFMCLCEARVMNTFVGANFVHRRTNKRPVKVLMAIFDDGMEIKL